MTAQEHTAELERLKTFLKSAILPQTPIKIGGYLTLNDLPLFIETSTIRAGLNIGSSLCEVNLAHLQQLEAYIKANG